MRRCARSLLVGLCLGLLAFAVQAQGAAAGPDAAAAAAGKAPAAASAMPPDGAARKAPGAEPVEGAVSKAPAAGAAVNLDDRIQAIKGEVLDLNRDLLVLEEELLFPANTQLAVFVSMDVGKLFALDSVQVKIDGTEIASYLYTPAEVQALHRGGVQRLYLGNLRSGPHELVALLTGKGPHDRDYRRGATLRFEKSEEARYIELQIKDSSGKLQPEFEMKVWQ